MANKKENILLQLKSISDNLGHSIKRRDCPYSLYADCVKYFGSFNKAKKLAGLKIVNVRITQFPDNAFRIDKDLAKISAYLTADGHLYKDLKGFQFYSNNKEKLKEFEEIIYQKFKLKGKYGEGTGYGKTFRYTIFNSSISKFLNKLGVPSGNKMFINGQQVAVTYTMGSSADQKFFGSVSAVCMEFGRPKFTKFPEGIRRTLEWNRERLYYFWME